jgi:uncharacterized membrane protein
MKAISWRILGSLVTTLVVYAMTSKLALSLGIASVELASKVGLYWVHERLWDRLPYGRRPQRMR